jgi:3-hydroxyacyl-[acyl-carrier-protein] dehydratase
MLLDSLFIVKKYAAEGSEIKATLELDENHAVFKGHFPDQPVVPGVCMMQSVKELVERYVKQKLTVIEADNMKFLSVLDPRVNKVIQATVSIVNKESSFSINASLFADNVTFFKLKATLNSSIGQG